MSVDWNQIAGRPGELHTGQLMVGGRLRHGHEWPMVILLGNAVLAEGQDAGEVVAVRLEITPVEASNLASALLLMANKVS